MQLKREKEKGNEMANLKYSKGKIITNTYKIILEQSIFVSY